MRDICLIGHKCVIKNSVYSQRLDSLGTEGIRLVVFYKNRIPTLEETALFLRESVSYEDSFNHKLALKGLKKLPEEIRRKIDLSSRETQKRLELYFDQLIENEEGKEVIARGVDFAVFKRVFLTTDKALSIAHSSSQVDDEADLIKYYESVCDQNDSAVLKFAFQDGCLPSLRKFEQDLTDKKLFDNPDSFLLLNAIYRPLLDKDQYLLMRDISERSKAELVSKGLDLLIEDQKVIA